VITNVDFLGPSMSKEGDPLPVGTLDPSLIIQQSFLNLDGRAWK